MKFAQGKKESKRMLLSNRQVSNTDTVSSTGNLLFLEGRGAENEERKKVMAGSSREGSN